MYKSFHCRTSRLLYLLCASFLLLTLSCTGVLASHGQEQPEKTGILLVAFGTSVPEAQVAFKNIDSMVKKAFPGVPVQWAYTSHIIRHKLAKQGQILLSPAQAMAKMADEGFTDVAVQSLHTIPGEEFHAMFGTTRAFQKMPNGIPHIAVGQPLLSSAADMSAAADALLANVPKERKPYEAVVFMGHGTPHPANVYYPGMQYYFSLKDPNVFVGTVEGSPTLDDVIKTLKARKIKKAYVMPFMSVAGDHARNDMAGDEPDSWKSVLTKAGIECVPVLKGTAEMDNVASIWIDHLKTAMQQLKH